MDEKLYIDGIGYSIPIIELPRSVRILDKVAEETEDGILYREVLGSYIDYNGVVFGTIDDVATYDALFDVLIQPVSFHTIVLPTNNKYNSFKAYITGVSDSVDRVLSDGTHFKALTCNFKANSPTIRAV